MLGALIECRAKSLWAFLLIVLPLSAGIWLILARDNYYSGLYFIALNLVVWLIIKACRTLCDVFSLNKQEAGITWCQIAILAALGIWIVGFILIFNIQKDGRAATLFGIFGSVVGWIFQDKLKGVVAFIHLRMHHLLNIGDWIRVPKYDADGEVKAVTLTTVTLVNWDTTTSTIPISALHEDHLMSFQNMSEGKTYGRRMIKTLIFDTECFHPLTEEEVENIKSEENADINGYLPAEEVKAGVLNAQLFREYVHHWMMNNPHVSQKPCLVVNWLDQKECGMPLQLYAFMLDRDLFTYEWRQSQIIEHIVKTMEVFGLKLYQAPSADDVRSLKEGLR